MSAVRLYQEIELTPADSARFWKRVERRSSNACWPWRRPRADGYGEFYWGGRSDRRRTSAHRVAWTLLVGPIPDTCSLDHLCRNPGCCNPLHLDPCPIDENIKRGAASRLVERDGLCTNGLHRWAENARLCRDGKLRCGACQQLRERRRRARRRLATP